MLISLITVISLACPLNGVNGLPLPAEPLIAVFYRTGSLGGVVASEVCYPGEMVSNQVPREYGCWYVTAWLIGGAESVPSETVCKQDPDPPCVNCHTSGL